MNFIEERVKSVEECEMTYSGFAQYLRDSLELQEKQLHKDNEVALSSLRDDMKQKMIEGIEREELKRAKDGDDIYPYGLSLAKKIIKAL